MDAFGKVCQQVVLVKSSIFIDLNFRGPLNLVTQIHEMRSVRLETPVVAIALETLERHLNFLTAELVVYSLFDLDVPEEERAQMALRLSSYAHQWEPGERLIYATSFPG